MSAIKKIISRVVKTAFLLLILFCVFLVWFSYRESDPVLQPYSPVPIESSKSVFSSIEFVVTGSDGIEVPGVILTKDKASEFSPLQSKMRDFVKRRGKFKDFDDRGRGQVVLISTSWDNAMENSMRMAEVLCGLGYTCVVWDPRGVEKRRQFCSYGLEESKDVPLLIDEVERKIGKVDLVSAIGRDFGAALLTQAAAKDVRIRSLVSIDNFCILKKSLSNAIIRDMGAIRGYPTFWLVDAAMSFRAGYGSFDVVPIDAARVLKIPVMIVCEDKYAFTSMEDSIKLYEALANNQGRKSLFAPLMQGEPFGTETRDYVLRHELKSGTVKEEHYVFNIYEDEDMLLAMIAEWLQENTLPPLPELILGGAAQ